MFNQFSTFKPGAYWPAAGVHLVSYNCFCVDACMCVCVCVCVCVPTPEAIYNWWCDMDPILLVKQVLQLL